MTAESGFGISDAALERVFQCCQGLLIAGVCIAFLADFFAKSTLVLFLGAFATPIVLALLVPAIVTFVWRRAGHRHWYQIALLLVWPVLLATVLVTSWPMKLSFIASMPALDRLAEQVAAGQAPPLPTRAGAYTIHAVETRPVTGGLAICLWTSSPGRGHIGFVQSPVGITPHVNPWTHTQLSPRWHHFGAD